MGAQASVRVPGHAPWNGVAGFNRPGERMRPELMIGTGSISKMYTAIAAMLLVDERRIALSDTLGRWFPDAANINPAVTLRQVLQQTSGLGDYATNPAFRQAVSAYPEHEWRPEEILPYIGAPLFAPGKGWNAANTNRVLLGLIVERETGAPLASFLRARIFGHSPSSWLSGDGPTPELLAAQWYVDSAGVRQEFDAKRMTRSVMSSRREIQASAADIARFGERVFIGDLLSDGLRARMLETVPPDGKIPGETGGGLGIRRYGRLGPLERTMYGHSGANLNNGSLLLFDPATRIVVAVTINQGAGHGNLQFTLAPRLLQTAIELFEPK